jgi:hypothetical protein
MIKLMLFMMLAAFGSTAVFATTPVCSLTQADRDANAGLSFEEFVQPGTLPSSWRVHDNAGCR